MYVPTLQELLDGVARTIETFVVPALQDRFARGQAEAAVAQLRGMTAHWAMIGEEARAENAEMRAMLAEIMPALLAASPALGLEAVTSQAGAALAVRFDEDQPPRSPTSLGAEGNHLGQIMVNLIHAFHAVQLDALRDSDLIDAQRKLRAITKQQALRREPTARNEEIMFQN